MPLYEYECKKCGEKTEVIRAFSDPPLTVCPACGGVLVKLLSSPAFQFKGSGFYLTDYGKSGSSQAGEKEKRDSAKSEEGKSAGGGETGDSSKGEKGSGSGASSPDAAASGEKSGGESSNVKKGGDAGAAKTSPAAAPPPAPSKKKKDTSSR